LGSGEEVPIRQGVSAAHRAQKTALRFGEGRVLGEAVIITAQLIQSNEGTFAKGINYPGLDNRQFALKMVSRSQTSKRTFDCSAEMSKEFHIL
jgi:hypothetical protein